MSSGMHDPGTADRRTRSGAAKDGLAALAVVVLAGALIALLITQIV
jgi:hypothetical protein